MASLFGGSLRLALKQSLAETGHLATTTDTQKKRAKKRKRGKLKKKDPTPPSEEYRYESEGDISSASSYGHQSSSFDEHELQDYQDTRQIYEANKVHDEKPPSSVKQKGKRRGRKKKTPKKPNLKSPTVPPPTPEIIAWARSIPDTIQRQSVAVGMRVKVRFNMGRKKKPTEDVSCSKWYGGRIADVIKKGKRIRITYDDGTKESTSFPENDVVIDDAGNGKHEVDVDPFIPQNFLQEENSLDDSSTSSEKYKFQELNDTSVLHNSLSNVVTSAVETPVTDIQAVVSSPPSNKVSTVTESSFSQGSSPSDDNNDSCESSYSDNSNEFNDTNNRIEGNVSTSSLNFSSSPPKKESFEEVENTHDKSVSSFKNNVSSLTIKLPAKLLSKNTLTKEIKDETEATDNSTPSLRISVTNTSKKKPTKKRLRQRAQETVPPDILLSSDEETKNEKTPRMNPLTNLEKGETNSNSEFKSKLEEKAKFVKLESAHKTVSTKDPFSSDDESSSDSSPSQDDSSSIKDKKVVSTENTSNDVVESVTFDENSRGKSDATFKFLTKKERKHSEMNLPNPGERSSINEQESSSSHEFSCDEGDSLHSRISMNKKSSISTSRRPACRRTNEKLLRKQILAGEENIKRKKRKEKSEIAIQDSPQMSLTSPPENSIEFDKDPWVQCDRCLKWRHLPPSTKMEELPERWYCEFNVDDPKRNNCNAKEQSLEEVAREKSFSTKISQTTKPMRVKLKKKYNSSSFGKSLREDRIEERADDNDVSRVSSGIKKNTPLEQNSARESIENDDIKTRKRKTRDPLKSDNDPEVKENSSKISRSDSLSDDSSEVELELDSPESVFRDVLDLNHDMKGKKSLRGSRRIHQNQAKGERDTLSKDNQEWVQCDKCKNWRTLPLNISAETLPEIWYCAMNHWDPTYSSCDTGEDKVDSKARGYSIVNRDPSLNHTSSNISNCNCLSNKPTYRNLIFGTSRRHYRPTSERARAADSFFSYLDVSDDACGTPRFLYADSSSFCPKSNKLNEETEVGGFLDQLDSSCLWMELYNHIGESTREQENLLEQCFSNVKFRRKDDHSSESSDTTANMILSCLSTDTLAMDELYFRLCKISHNISLDDILEELHYLTVEDRISLERSEHVEVVREQSSNNDELKEMETSKFMKLKKPWKIPKDVHMVGSENNEELKI